jgi:hypothetical protein
MKTFIGIKIIQAIPEQREGRPGYAVTYSDGYESWSPKEAFDAAYIEITDNASLTAEQIVERLVDLRNILAAQ